MIERSLIRTLHLVLSIPIIGFIYGPVAHIPPAANFTRFVAVPARGYQRSLVMAKAKAPGLGTTFFLQKVTKLECAAFLRNASI